MVGNSNHQKPVASLRLHRFKVAPTDVIAELNLCRKGSIIGMQYHRSHAPMMFSPNVRTGRHCPGKGHGGISRREIGSLLPDQYCNRIGELQRKPRIGVVGPHDGTRLCDTRIIVYDDIEGNGASGDQCYWNCRDIRADPERV